MRQCIESYKGLSDCIRKYTYVKSFQRLAKENHAWFYERHLMRRYEKSGLKHSIVLPNENISEQEFENFNRDEVGKFSNKEPICSDNDSEDEEYKSLSYEDFILSFDES